MTMKTRSKCVGVGKQNTTETRDIQFLAELVWRKEQANTNTVEYEI